MAIFALEKRSAHLHQRETETLSTPHERFHSGGNSHIMMTTRISKGGSMKPQAGRVSVTLALAIVAVMAMWGTGASAQSTPYQEGAIWGKLPEGRTWGQVIGLDVDRRGNVWVFDRCGGTTCAGSPLSPIFEFDREGKMMKTSARDCLSFRTGSPWTRTATSGRPTGREKTARASR